MKKFDELPKKLLKWDEILKPGTPFWYISHGTKQIKEKCSVCKGKGKVVLEGNEYECPECRGDGYFIKYEPERWRIVPNFKTEYWVVTKVEIKSSDKVGEYEVMYWDNCNGFRAERVFTSRIVATKTCNKLNKKLEENDLALS